MMFARFLNEKKIIDVFEGRYVECKNEKDENSSTTEYLGNIRPHLRDMINENLRESGE